MIKTKSDYILKSLKKLSHKTWELFIITRILHKLDDDCVEFVTQQLVKRPDGRRAHTDIYFPQLDLHLEIDEPHHSNQLHDDDVREQDIIMVTGHKIKRIKIEGKTLPTIRSETDNFIQTVKELKRARIERGDFAAWDWVKKFSAKPIIDKGYMAVADNVTFRTQAEAMRCFGFTGKGFQRGAWIIPDGTQDIVWFPRLFTHNIWENELSADGKHIFERAINDEAVKSIAKQLKESKDCPDRKFIVFAKAKDSLGANLLRYVGIFRLNLFASTERVIRFDLLRTKEYVGIGY